MCTDPIGICDTYSYTTMTKELTYEPLETEAREKKGPRDFFYARKISLKNYDPRRQYETEDFGLVHDSFEEARELVELSVKKRIAELRGIEPLPTKE
jgi:hypothetical protein